MSGLDGRVVEWMRAHRTTVTTQFLSSVGVSEWQRRHLVRSGVLVRVLDGVYRFGGVAEDEHMRCVALCTRHPLLVVAGPTAGRHWRIRRSPRDETVHVIGPPRSQPCSEPWVQVYRTALLHPDEIVRFGDGMRVTSASRTAIDLARYLDDIALASAIEFVLAEGLCTMTKLRRLAERLNTPGRPWVRKFLRVLDARNPGRARESDWERRVLDALVARGVADVESQVWERLPGHGAARFDLAIPEIRWVLEIDVHPEHRSLEGQFGDHRRDRQTKRVGWETDRVGEAELATDFEWTMDDVVASVAARRVAVAALKAAGIWAA